MATIHQNSKASSYGFDQRNSLMHHNEIIGSSIVINIIVNGKNETAWKPNEPTSEAPWPESTADPYPDAAYQVPDIGKLRVMDRYIRPLITERSTEPEA